MREEEEKDYQAGASSAQGKEKQNGGDPVRSAGEGGDHPQVAEEIVGEGITPAGVVIHRAAGIGEHGEEGEGEEYGASNGDPKVELAQLNLEGREGCGHMENYTREADECQGAGKAQPAVSIQG